MAFQTPITIATAMENIQQNRYLLPAIQREFVWDHGRIEWLFDSIMQGYPISSFLLWNVKKETAQEYKFYTFLSKYRQNYKTHNEEISPPHDNFMAILDGQQRLTSLHIGLAGSYAYKRPRVRDENTEHAYPTRRLFLDIETKLNEEEAEDKRVYNFRFLTEGESQSEEKWFKVADIHPITNVTGLMQHFKEREYSDEAQNMLSRLQEAIHSDKFINFYQEESQELDRALNIFIRINSGGEPLDFSDLIMSIAVANWETKDARSEIHELVDNVRDLGFKIKKDLVLKTFLYLHSSDIKFTTRNFTVNNAKDFEQKWDDIRDAILSTFRLIKTFGFTDKTVVSKNAVIPIVYYIYHKRIWDGFQNKKYEDDRKVIRKWLHCALLKRWFGAASDTTLTLIRRQFTQNVVSSPMDEEISMFPADGIKNAMIRSGQGSVDDEFIDELLCTAKNDKYSFSILALLYPHLDIKHNGFHKDHLHPESLCTKNGMSKKDYDCIKNLQLLDGMENESKGDMQLEEWVGKKVSEGYNRDELLNRQLIPDTDLSLEAFNQFIIERSKMLKKKLKSSLQ